jgi:hypothetical protein
MPPALSKLGTPKICLLICFGQEIDKMPKEPPVGVRFQKEVKLALEKLARSDDRTISYVINKIVVEYLRAKKLIK